MIKHRKSGARGRAEQEWLKSWFSFSFDQYRDPENVHWSSLRVINEDIIAPRQGFSMHPHHNMEIISFIIDGALEHQDSLGNKSTVRYGEIQRMSAGSGIVHSEFNPDPQTPTHMLQIWIFPKEKNLTPSWEQLSWMAMPEQQPGLRLIASPDGQLGSTKIGQEASIFHLDLEKNSTHKFQICSGRRAWMHVINGEVEVKSELGDILTCESGDGLGFAGEPTCSFLAHKKCNLLWFDMP